jgi:xanthine dehydrogenase small subunit
MLYSSYFLPQSISQAIDTLINAKGEGIVFNGGTDLIIKLKDDHNSGKTLIDLSRLKELKIIRNEEHSLAIGSGLTFLKFKTPRL